MRHSLPCSKTIGIDKIVPKIQKFCFTALYQSLCHLFTLTISQHILPNEWIAHTITTIIKSGDRTQVIDLFLTFVPCLKYWNVSLGK